MRGRYLTIERGCPALGWPNAADIRLPQSHASHLSIYFVVFDSILAYYWNILEVKSKICRVRHTSLENGEVEQRQCGSATNSKSPHQHDETAQLVPKTSDSFYLHLTPPLA